MANPSATTNVMLAVHEKKTNPVDLYRPLRQYLAHRYSERDAVDNEDDLQTVQEMRSEIEKTTDSLEARRDLLQRYFRALCVMESRFPISSEKEHVNTITFTWFDAFKGKKASQQNIHFEKASIMFNLAAVYSQLGLAADRSTPNGIKQACNTFQAAAGAFAFLRDNVSLKASINGATLDISAECAGMLERLMLAQAQECFFEKVITDKKPPSLCAKVARQVGLYYEETHAALSLPPLNQHFDKAWVAHVQVKGAQFLGEACYRASLDLHEKEDIAEEIARLKVAASTLATAKRSSKGVVAPLLDTITKLEATITSNLERAIKENDRVYLMRIPSAASLAALPAASLVKSTNLSDVLDGSKEKMFTRLVPDNSVKALSRYTELLDDILRTQFEKLQQESELTRVKLREMGLPESLYALEGSTQVPEQLRSDVESIQLDGGLAGLQASVRQLQDLRRVNEELLVQTEELLQKESDEDAQFRSQFGSRWKRPPSNTVSKGFQEHLSSFAVKLKQASDMDARIERSIKDNWELMRILDVKPIEASLPTLTRPIMSLDGDEDVVVGSLKQSLAQLEGLGSQRAGLEDALKDMKQKDNILPKLLSSSGSSEDLFKRELAKYDPICMEISKNVEAQDQLLKQIMMQNKTFAAVFNLEDFQVACDRAFKQLSAATSKYREIQDNIKNAGIKFYVSLQDAINTLKQQCTDYVTTREAQNREMIETLQRQLAGFSFRDNTSSMSYPALSSPSQRGGAPPGPSPPPSHPAYYATGPPNSTPQPPPHAGPLPQNTRHHMQPWSHSMPQPPPPVRPPTQNTGHHTQQPPRQTAYYSSPGANQASDPSYLQAAPLQTAVPYGYGQPPTYPGWQPPYYSAASVNSTPPQSSGPPYQAPPAAPYYQPPHGDYYR